MVTVHCSLWAKCTQLSPLNRSPFVTVVVIVIVVVIIIIIIIIIIIVIIFINNNIVIVVILLATFPSSISSSTSSSSLSGLSQWIRFCCVFIIFHNFKFQNSHFIVCMQSTSLQILEHTRISSYEDVWYNITCWKLKVYWIVPGGLFLTDRV